jgi:hypothetical protein
MYNSWLVMLSNLRSLGPFVIAGLFISIVIYKTQIMSLQFLKCLYVNSLAARPSGCFSKATMTYLCANMNKSHELFQEQY